ncbi:MAG: hypothetical protein P8176_12555 [Gammaproteobacteria bacterium]
MINVNTVDKDMDKGMDKDVNSDTQTNERLQATATTKSLRR